MPLSLVDAFDATDALAQALAIRAAGGVPLIVDPRAPIEPRLLDYALPTEAAWAVLTSGTTGSPKVVVRSEASWQVAFAALNHQLGLKSGEGIWMPVHQVSSMALFTAAWAAHSELELVIPAPQHTRLDQAAVAHLTPAWLQRLLNDLEAGQPTSLHTVLVGGDHLPAAVLDRATSAGLRVVSYAGAAELSFVAWDLGDGLRAFPGVCTRIVNDQLWVASAQTALAAIGGHLQHKVVDGIEWASVGDRVTESDGVLEFLGRSDGAILTAAATVIPAEVQTVLDQHPGVTASLVMGQPDAQLGQRVVAWVEGEATIASLRDWVATRLPKAARPIQWHRVEYLPRTVSGKIRRVAPEVS